MSRQGSNYFHSCETCGMPGHDKEDCPLKDHYHYHKQCQRALAKGSKDKDVIREVYGARLERKPSFQC
jgi:hypothetical protein